MGNVTQAEHERKMDIFKEHVMEARDREIERQRQQEEEVEHKKRKEATIESASYIFERQAQEDWYNFVDTVKKNEPISECGHDFDDFGLKDETLTRRHSY